MGAEQHLPAKTGWAETGLSRHGRARAHRAHQLATHSPVGDAQVPVNDDQAFDPVAPPRKEPVTYVRHQIDGVPIDWIEVDEAIARIADAAKARSFVQVSTVNLDFLTNARRDSEARTILTNSGLSLPDGAPIVWLGRLRGTRPPGRVAGSDLVPRLMERAAAEGLPVFFLGGENGAARAAADRLVARHPELKVSVYEPPRAALEGMDNEEIFRRLAEAQPAILLVAFGHPKQEKWIHRHGERLPMVGMGVGCSFDLIAGQRRRAPLWMQRRGLEWFFRLANEPGRLVRRYVTDGLWLMAVFFPITLFQRVLGRP